MFNIDASYRERLADGIPPEVAAVLTLAETLQELFESPTKDQNAIGILQDVASALEELAPARRRYT